MERIDYEIEVDLDQRLERLFGIPARRERPIDHEVTRIINEAQNLPDKAREECLKSYARHYEVMALEHTNEACKFARKRADLLRVAG